MQHWPSRLWIVRHGQSAGNVARDRADAEKLERIGLEERDVDVPLSALGRRQAEALGRWFAAKPADERPDSLLVSPYVRAIQTAELLRGEGAMPADEPLCIDERLREKEFGVIDGLTTLGIEHHFPQQFALRRQLGKFYHRAPGGESWCDVILRLRSLIDTMALHYAGRRVMIVAHQVVVLCMRYILEQLDEATILAIDAEGDVANCSITEYRFNGELGKSGRMLLERYNMTVAVEAEDVPVTAAKDAPAGPRG